MKQRQARWLLATMKALSQTAFMNDSTSPSALAQAAKPDELSRKLAYAGLAPFVAGALFVFLLTGRVEDEPFNFVVFALSSYAALAVAFLGGLPWGLLMLRTAGGQAVPDVQPRAVWAGAIYMLSGWIALLMPPHAGLVVLGVLLIACYLTDRKLYPELGVAGWLTLRFRLTLVASLSCFLAAAQI